MEQFTLWFNMLTFALLVAAAGLVYLVYLRGRQRWLRSFVGYTAGYAAWLLFGTYVFFQAVFLPVPIVSLTLVFAYVRVGVSMIILFVGAVFYLGIAAEWNSRSTLVTATALLVVGVLVTLFLGWDLVWAGTVVTIGFNFYFGCLAAYALVKVGRAGDSRRRMTPFLVYSTVAHAALVITSIVLLFLPAGSYAGIPINVIATGLFCALWGLLMIVVASRWMALGARTPQGQVPSAFIEDRGISRREAEIIYALREGLTSREIGERLFISQRTVETHIQNVYRKCGVASRIELVNEISRYLES